MPQRRLLAALAVLPLLASCSTRSEARTPRRLVLATGPKGAVFYPIGVALARIYNRCLPDVHVEAVDTPGAVFNMDAIEAGEAQLGFSQRDPAYVAFTKRTPKNARRHLSLRAIAVLYGSALQIAVRRDGPIQRIDELRGRRVGIGPEGSGTEVASRIVMEAYGLDLGKDVELRHLKFDEATDQLIRGELDAHFMMTSIPAPAIVRVDKVPGVRLLSVAPRVMETIRSRYSFYRKAVVPGGTYHRQDQEVQTLGADNLLVCRASLEDDLVRRLTEVLLDSVAELGEAHPAARGIDPDAALATPIPLHPGAARFYRERELFR